MIKTLVLPILNHLIISLPNPSDSVFRKINEIFYTFVWNSPIHRVKKDVLIKEYLEGGLKMIDLYSFTMALKSSWIRRFFQRDNKWQSILMSDIDKNKLFNCGVQYIKQVSLLIKNNFWKDVFRAWEMIIDKERNLDYDYFLSSPIWFNNMIRIGNKPVFYQHWFNHGIQYVNDVIDEHGFFISLEMLQQCYDINVNFLNYMSVISAIKKAANNYKKDTYKLCCPFIPACLQVFFKSRKGSKDMYKILINNNVTPTGQLKWGEILGEDLIWKHIFKLPFTVTVNTKLQWLQYRINHRILATNKFLCKIKLIDNPLCTFCKLEDETVEHILWNCEIIQNFLQDIDYWFLSGGVSLPLNKLNFIFGDISKIRKGDPYNLIFLYTKQYIYNSGCFLKDLSLSAIKEKLKYMYNLEKIMAVKNKRQDHFDTMWNAFKELF